MFCCGCQLLFCGGQLLFCGGQLLFCGCQLLLLPPGEAYAILSDPTKKRRYDNGEDLEDMQGHGHGHGGMDASNIFAQMFARKWMRSDCDNDCDSDCDVVTAISLSHTCDLQSRVALAAGLGVAASNTRRRRSTTRGAGCSGRK